VKSPDEEFEDLRVLYPDVQRVMEGGLLLALFPRLRIAARSGIVETVAVLYPYADGGYTTRLFVADAIQGTAALNWRPRTIAGLSLQTCSWNQVPADRPWIEILANHLRAFQ